MSFSRRGFLGFAAGAAAGSVVGGYGGSAFSKLTASLDLAVYPPGGPETWALSICRECPGGCGLRVRSIGGKPVKVDGNPLHPVSGGQLCPKGQATLQALYHPDRIRTPLRRVGARGDLGPFPPASWAEAPEAI
ncbi:MAG: nitrate reductase, partial [Planctomycetes bacterium]|nr:nitrate reductase [Planctomycetota bacterium]